MGEQHTSTLFCCQKPIFEDHTHQGLFRRGKEISGERAFFRVHLLMRCNLSESYSEPGAELRIAGRSRRLAGTPISEPAHWNGPEVFFLFFNIYSFHDAMEDGLHLQRERVFLF